MYTIFAHDIHTYIYICTMDIIQREKSGLYPNVIDISTKVASTKSCVFVYFNSISC